MANCNFKRQPNTIYVLSLSYGKDSMACLGAIKQLGLPLDLIIHADIWATETIPADLPPMVEFKKKADKIIEEKYGIKVEHVCAMESIDNGGGGCLHTKKSLTQKPKHTNTVNISTVSQKEVVLGVLKGLNKTHLKKQTYENIFLKEYKDKTRIYGFPVSVGKGGNWCTSMLKKRAFSLSPKATGGINIVQYLGIASDEPKRIKKHQKKKDIILPLVMAGWDEAYCREWCEKNDLLSPIYTTETRGGCWFCHNQGVDQLRRLRKNYPDLWAILLEWDLQSPTYFNAHGHTVHDFDKRFEMEDKGIISKDEIFYWKYLKELPAKQQTIFDIYKGE